MAPHPIKLMIIRSYMKRFSIDHFIETGTNLGDTLGYFAKKGVHCASIELSQALYKGACAVFGQRRNVMLIFGDSSQELPALLKNINKPALFWLDGHYSCGITARAAVQTPISAELDAILAHAIKRHVILIDDARCFDGTNDYPHLDDMLRVIREDGRYAAEVSADIIRLVPRIEP